MEIAASTEKDDGDGYKVSQLQVLTAGTLIAAFLCGAAWLGFFDSRLKIEREGWFRRYSDEHHWVSPVASVSANFFDFDPRVIDIADGDCFTGIGVKPSGPETPPFVELAFSQPMTAMAVDVCGMPDSNQWGELLSLCFTCKSLRRHAHPVLVHKQTFAPRT
jgi:hypothetical protein